jgi:hypothetical protein
LEEAPEEVDRLELRNDEDWKSVGEKRKEWEIEKLSSVTFWKGLKVKDGFNEILIAVLPYFSRDPADTSKTKVIPKIVEHLKWIAKISKGEAPNTLSPATDLTGKGRVQILSHFVKHDQTTFLAEKESLSEQSQSAYDAIMLSCGVECRICQCDSI